MTSQEINDFIRNNQDKSNWEIARLLRDKGVSITPNAISLRHRSMGLPPKSPYIGRRSLFTSTVENKNNQTPTEKILEKYHVTPQELEKLLEAQKPRYKLYTPRESTKYKFGIVSDTHLADKQCALSELKDFYKRCKQEGITEMVHTGDFLTGISVYRGQINDLVCFGVDDHLKFAVENYPREEGITTYCISGNHDENYKIHGGVEIIEHIQKHRSDIKYLGMYDATVVLNGVKVGLHHGAGAPA